MSEIPEHRLDPQAFREKGAIFPDYIEDDERIFYHGTSSIAEAEIERVGIRTSAAAVTDDDIRQLLRCYEDIRWDGLHLGGIGVLKIYCKSDRLSHTVPTASLAYTAQQAVLYALSEWAGGEAARAMRYAFLDLDRFILENDTRTQHAGNHNLWAKQRRDAAQRRDVAWTDLDPDDLRRRVVAALASMVEVRARCNYALATHKDGVIYAVREDDEDAALIEDSVHTLRWSGGVPLSRIVGKVRVPAEFTVRTPMAGHTIGGFPHGHIHRYWKRLGRIGGGQ